MQPRRQTRIRPESCKEITLRGPTARRGRIGRKGGVASLPEVGQTYAKALRMSRSKSRCGVSHYLYQQFSGVLGVVRQDDARLSGRMLSDNSIARREFDSTSPLAGHILARYSSLSTQKLHFVKYPNATRQSATLGTGWPPNGHAKQAKV